MDALISYPVFVVFPHIYLKILISGMHLLLHHPAHITTTGMDCSWSNSSCVEFVITQIHYGYTSFVVFGKSRPNQLIRHQQRGF